MGDTLYHYCSNAAFVSMFTSRKIRLSLLTLSNDTSEGRYLRHVVEEMVESHPAQKRKRAFDYIDEEMKHIFGLGFCMSGKRDLLSQWRGYADDGRGVAIGFDAHVLAERFRSDRFISMTKVLYDIDSQMSAVEFVIDELVGGGRSAVVDLFGVQSDLFRIKNPFFTEETETRIISAIDTRVAGQEISGTRYPALSDSKFMGLADRIKPYQEIALLGDSVKEIVLGPRNVTPNEVVEAFLSSLKLSGIEVSRSAGTYA